MPITKRRLIIERNIEAASARLNTYSQKVEKEKKLAGKKKRLDALYRHLEAELRQQKSRLAAIDRVVAVNEELAQRRAERLAQPKVKKERVKKAPVEAAPKGKKAK